MSIATEINRLQTAKADIKTAIENKGVTIPSTVKLDGFPPYINQIHTGSDTSDATATAAEIFSGKTAYISNGKVTGTYRYPNIYKSNNTLYILNS